MEQLISWHYSIDSEEFLLGFDPLRVSPDNPMGQVYGTRHFIRAENAFGEKIVHIGLYAERAQAEADMAKMDIYGSEQAEGDWRVDDPGFNPMVLGSPASITQGYWSDADESLA